MQAQVEEEEMEKMRLGAALATLRAEMEALSPLRTTSTPGRTYHAEAAAGVKIIELQVGRVRDMLLGTQGLYVHCKG